MHTINCGSLAYELSKCRVPEVLDCIPPHWENLFGSLTMPYQEDKVAKATLVMCGRLDEIVGPQGNDVRLGKKLANNILIYRRPNDYGPSMTDVIILINGFINRGYEAEIINAFNCPSTENTEFMCIHQINKRISLNWLRSENEKGKDIEQILEKIQKLGLKRL